MKKSFTLFELILAISISSIIVSLIFQTLLQITKEQIYIKKLNEANLELDIGVKIIEYYLSYSIKESIIARNSNSEQNIFLSIASPNTKDYNILEWIGSAYKLQLGIWNKYTQTNQTLWSGIIDLDDINNTNYKLKTPASNLLDVSKSIEHITNGKYNSFAIIFYQQYENFDVSEFGYYNGLNHSHKYIYKAQAIDNTHFELENKNTKNISAIYNLVFSAYALELKDNTLYFYYDYQPWNKQFFDTDANITKILNNVTLFTWQYEKSDILIHICTKNSIEDEDITLCRDLAI